MKLSPAFLNLGRNRNPIKSLRSELDGDPTIEAGNPNEWSERIGRLQNLCYWIAEKLIEAHERQAKYIN